jgi:nitronate monooxygenase
VPKFQSGATGNVEALAHYAGQSAASVEDVRPAATIVDELVRGAAAALGRVLVQH